MEETEILDIERLVSLITSTKVRDETKLKLFTQLAYDKKGHVHFPEQYVNKMIGVCLGKSDELDLCIPTGEYEEKGNWLLYAARIANYAGRTEQAQKIYGQIINFQSDLYVAILAFEATPPKKLAVGKSKNLKNLTQN